MATSASPWGGGASGTPWGGGKRRAAKAPADQTAPSGAPPAPAQPQTFAQMQANGQARPAPPPPHSGPMVSGSPMVSGPMTSGKSPESDAYYANLQKSLPQQTTAAVGGQPTLGNGGQPMVSGGDPNGYQAQLAKQFQPQVGNGGQPMSSGGGTQSDAYYANLAKQYQPQIGNGGLPVSSAPDGYVPQQPMLGNGGLPMVSGSGSPSYSPGGATIDGGLPAQTAAATGWHLGDPFPGGPDRQAAFLGQMNDGIHGSAPLPVPPNGLGQLPAATAAATGGTRTAPPRTNEPPVIGPGAGPPVVGGPGTTGPGGTPAPYQINQQAPAIQGDLMAATQKALANPDPYATDVMQAQRAAGQAQLTQQFGAQQKMLDEEMARRGIGASSIASGYYGDLAGQQATAQAGLESNVLSDEANRQQQGLATALGAGNQLYGAQSSSGLGYSQLGLQNALGQGQLGLGQQQLNNQNTQFGQNLDQQLKLGTMSDTTANRGIDVQNQTNVNQNQLQIMALLAQIGGSGDNKALADAVAKLLGQNTGGGTGTGTGGGSTGTGGGSTDGGSTDPGASAGTTGTNGGTQTPGTGNGYTPPPGVPWTPKIPTDTPESFYNPTGAILGGLAGQTQSALGNDGKALPTGVQKPGDAQNGVQLNTNSSGQAASGGPIEDQLLSLTPAQSQDVYGFALSRKPSDYESLGTAGANGFIDGVGNTTPGETVMRDKTTGHMMPLSKLKSQAWWVQGPGPQGHTE